MNQVLETYYSNSNGEVIPPVSSFANQVLQGKKAISYSPSGAT